MAAGAGFTADERSGRLSGEIVLLLSFYPQLIRQPTHQYQGCRKQNADKNYFPRLEHQFPNASKSRRLGDARCTLT
jgi:hypothetical protein